MRRTRPLVAGMVVLALAPPALASFHIMQIEQVIAGIGGDNTRQAIQLRTREIFQNFVTPSRIRAWDAAGANPVLLVDFTSDVGPTELGTRILSTTTGFSANGQGPASDFTMVPIPASYLAAGRITFEDDGGAVLWSLCWGGAAYTGPTTGGFTNDNDGNFGPCINGPLPVAAAQAVRFTPGAGAPSTTNLANYEVTAGPATFTNSLGASARVVEMFEDGFESPATVVAPAAAKRSASGAPKHAHDHGDGFIPDPTRGKGKPD
jgi:hypothetical protein